MNADTRTLLLSEAEMIVRQQGYAGFSYADLSGRVGIRKASIHHHFPAKEDLGVALVEAYTGRIQTAVADISDGTAGSLGRIALYVAIYRDGLEAGLGCLCGVLAAEFAGLPERMRAAVRRFFVINTDWLAGVLAEGQRDGAVRADVAAADLADGVLACMQGAMVVGQGDGSAVRFDRAAAAMLAGLQAPAR